MLDNQKVLSSHNFYNDIQQILQENKLDQQFALPELAVIGEQSIGKSSLLNKIIGINLLPEGSGTVTTCPIVIQLEKAENESLSVQKKEFQDYLAVKSEIKKQMEENQKFSGKIINSRPIYVRIRSKNVPNLTITDLPGIIKTEDIEDILTMATQYIKKENVIILAVCDAYVDAVNSIALQLSKQVDPDGERTLGIMNKMDKLENQGNIEVLNGNVFSFHYGWHGVICKLENVADHEFVRKEKEYYSQNEEKYKKVESSKLGIEALTQHLTEIFHEACETFFKEIEQNVRNLLEETELQLSNYACDYSMNDVLKQFNNFWNAFYQILEKGTYLKSSTANPVNLSARIKDKLDLFKVKVTEKHRLDAEEFDQKIKNKLIEKKTYNPSREIGCELAEEILNLEILETNTLSKFTLEEIKAILDEVLRLASNKLDDYPKLKNLIQSKMVEKLAILMDQTIKSIHTHIIARASSIDWDHDDYIPEQIKIQLISSKESTHKIKILTFLVIFRKEITSIVPTYIRSLCIKKLSSEDTKSEITAKFLGEDPEVLLQAKPDIEKKKKMLKARLKSLRKVEEKIEKYLNNQSFYEVDFDISDLHLDKYEK